MADKKAKNDKTKPSTDNPGQQASNEQGDIFQAGGDIHIHKPPESKKEKKGCLGITHPIVAIVAGLITIFIGVCITIPNWTRQKNHPDPPQSDSSKLAKTPPVTGIVRDRKTKSPIADAFVTSDLTPHDTIRTTTDGTFQFMVTALPGSSIRIFVGADQYQLRNEFHVIGSSIEIDLDKK